MKLVLVILLAALLVNESMAMRTAPQSYNGVEPSIQFDLLKRADGYGWNDCEFSPLSCLLKRRRRSTTFE